MDGIAFSRLKLLKRFFLVIKSSGATQWGFRDSFQFLRDEVKGHLAFATQTEKSVLHCVLLRIKNLRVYNSERVHWKSVFLIYQPNCSWKRRHQVKISYLRMFKYDWSEIHYLVKSNNNFIFLWRPYTRTWIYYLVRYSQQGVKLQ